MGELISMERKRRLRKLIPPSHTHVLFANHIECQGKALFYTVCARDLEGIVGKRKLSKYSKGGWLKIKNPDYSQGKGRREMFEWFRT